MVRLAQRRNGLVFAVIVMPRPVYVIQRRLACAVCTGINVTRVPLTIASRVRHMYAPSKCRHSGRWILRYELQTMASESSEWLREPEGYQGGRVEPLGRLDPITLPDFLRALSG